MATWVFFLVIGVLCGLCDCTQQEAEDYCSGLGPDWNIEHIDEQRGSLYCIRAGTTTNQNCNDCDTYRIVVWLDGGGETLHDLPSYPFETTAGFVYSSHTNPCTNGPTTLGLPCDSFSGEMPTGTGEPSEMPTGSGEPSEMPEPVCFLLGIAVTTYTWGHEVEFRITDDSGAVLANEDGFTDNGVWDFSYPCVEIDRAWSIEYIDSYGDGWHGGVFMVTINDHVVLNVQPEGYGGLFTICEGCSSGITSADAYSYWAAEYEQEVATSDGCFELGVDIQTATWGTEVEFKLQAHSLNPEVISDLSDFEDNQAYQLQFPCLEYRDRYSLAYLDTYGDGWHGGTITVTIDGVRVFHEKPKQYGDTLWIYQGCTRRDDVQCVDPFDLQAVGGNLDWLWAVAAVSACCCLCYCMHRHRQKQARVARGNQRVQGGRSFVLKNNPKNPNNPPAPVYNPQPVPPPPPAPQFPQQNHAMGNHPMGVNVVAAVPMQPLVAIPLEYAPEHHGGVPSYMQDYDKPPSYDHPGPEGKYAPVVGEEVPPPPAYSA